MASSTARGDRRPEKKWTTLVRWQRASAAILSWVISAARQRSWSSRRLRLSCLVPCVTVAVVTVEYISHDR